MDNLTPITREEMLMNDEPMTPITREEKILAGEDLNPVTRREYFLKKYRHAGGDVMVEGLSVTANGTYTAPEGKAYSPVEVAVPLPDNAYLLKTASGSLVSFPDGADLPMPSFICKIEAVQSGSGDPSPENVRPISGHTGVNAWVRGKNLWSFGDITQLIDGAEFHLKAGTYTIKADVSNVGTTLVGLRMFYADDTNILVTLSNTNNYQKTFTLTSDVVKINASVTNGTATNVQLEIGETASTYTPYNPNSQTIQLSWQTEAGEVFGGYVDLVSGVLTVTHKSQTGFTRGSQDSSNKLYKIGAISDIKAYANVSAISPYYVDSMFEKMSLQGARAAETPSITHHDHTFYVGGYIGKEAELDTLLETLQVKYELATPQTYQLTPQQIKSLLGYNNAWCDTGDVTSEYFGKEVTG